VSADYLAAYAVALGQPIYWAGKRPGQTLELTRTGTPNGIFVRYLPRGVPVGDPAAAYPVIGTYQVKGALAALQHLAAKGHQSFQTKNGGLGVVERPTRVYVAWPGRDVQVEVFDPSRGGAHRLVDSGLVTTVR
jgi:hypothetical protein